MREESRKRSEDMNRAEWVQVCKRRWEEISGLKEYCDGIEE